MRNLIFFLLVASSLSPAFSVSKEQMNEERFVAYTSSFDAYNSQISSLKTDDEKLQLTQQIFEKYLSLSKSDNDDYLAKSYAGLTGMRRCSFVTNLTRQGKYSFESFGFLDEALKAVEKQFQANGSLAPHMILVLKNRAEIYSSVPKFFGKAKIAVDDAKRSLELATKSPHTPEGDLYKLKLLEVRARAGIGESHEAKQRFDLLRKELEAKSLTSKLIEDILRTEKKLAEEG